MDIKSKVTSRLSSERSDVTALQRDTIATVVSDAIRACQDSPDKDIREAIAEVDISGMSPYCNRLLVSERGYMFNLVRSFLALR